MTRGFLIDTNHLSAAINPVSRLRERLYQEHRAGVRFRTCVPVLCELEAGIQDSAHVHSYRRQLAHLFRKVKLIPIEPAMAPTYGEIYSDLRRRGRPMSQVDMMLAAIARMTNLSLLTSDLDFSALPDIRAENWLANAPTA